MFLNQQNTEVWKLRNINILTCSLLQWKKNPFVFTNSIMSFLVLFIIIHELWEAVVVLIIYLWALCDDQREYIKTLRAVKCVCAMTSCQSAELYFLPVGFCSTDDAGWQSTFQRMSYLPVCITSCLLFLVSQCEHETD